MKTDYNKEIFNKFINSENWKREKSVLDNVFKHPIWWFTDKAGGVSHILRKSELTCESLNPSIDKPSICRQSVLEAINKSRNKITPRKFTCSGGLEGICMPLTNGVKKYGFIGICHVKK